MATINGTSSNDTLISNDFENDDFFGFGGDDTYEYGLDGWDDTITETSGDDELSFDTGISRYMLSLVRIGDDLLVRTSEAGTITIINHFLSPSNELETITFSSDPALDLSASNILIQEKNIYGNYDPLYATNSTDVIYGGATAAEYAANPDVYSQALILALDGHDIIYANYALVYGGDGNDTIYGRSAIYGDAGNDTIYITENSFYYAFASGDDGDDIIYGSSMYDSIFGGAGVDLLYGYGGDDGITAGTGDDVIYGGDGNDSISGQEGNDIIYGESGNDTLDAGDGEDVIYGGDGDDHITSLDSFGYAASGDKDLYGGNGDDYIQDGVGNDFISGGDGNDTINAVNRGNDVVYGGAGNDTIAAYTNTITQVEVYGETGNDVITYGGYPGWGVSYLYGGSDNDTYETSLSGGYPWQDIGNSTFIFDDSGSADVFRVHDTASTVTIFSVSGTDLILSFSTFSGIITITDMFIAAHRIESFDFTNKTGSLFETLTNSNNNYTGTSSTSHLGIDQNFIEGLGGNDTINGGVGNDGIWGGTGTDTLNGNADNDWLFGEGDNDTLRGGTGDDLLDGGSGTDTASYSTATAAVTVNLSTNTSSGADGSDTFVSIEDIRGSSYADNLTGDANNNTIAGGNGNDTIYGGDGSDLLYGEANNDTIYGGDGNDTLFGGAGNDYMNGENGNDTVDYSGATGATITVNLSNASAQATGEGTDTILNIENYNGSNQVDNVTGTSGANIIRGNAGADTINAGSGNDTIFGGDGNDTLNGQDDDDTIYGGLGNDTINGGNGIDTVNYFTSATAVTVNLLGGTATGEGSDTISNIENVEGSVFADTITGNALGNILLGGTGNDTLSGGDGADFLYGNDGADTFILQGETAFNNIDVIADFVNGTAGDFINIADVLLDFGYDALTDTLSDWVSAVTSGANTLLQIDRDGTGSSYAMATIAQVNNVNLSLTDLTTDGNLIT